MNSALNKKNGMQFIPERKLNYHPWIATVAIWVRMTLSAK